MNQSTTSSEQDQDTTANDINLNDIESLADNNQGEDMEPAYLVPVKKKSKGKKKKSQEQNTDQEEISDDEISKLAKRNKINADYYDRMDKHFYKREGLRFIFWCLIGYAGVVVVDSLLQTFFEIKISSYADGFIELLKYIISTLIGFVFADTRHKDDK